MRIETFAGPEAAAEAARIRARCERPYSRQWGFGVIANEAGEMAETGRVVVRVTAETPAQAKAWAWMREIRDRHSVNPASADIGAILQSWRVSQLTASDGRPQTMAILTLAPVTAPPDLAIRIAFCVCCTRAMLTMLVASGGHLALTPDPLPLDDEGRAKPGTGRLDILNLALQVSTAEIETALEAHQLAAMGAALADAVAGPLGAAINPAARASRN